jgi:peroxiredoxin/uncharacterized protein YndB with AHSA1/START domain
MSIATPPRLGQTVPDFTAITSQGERFRLNDALRAQKTTVLVFYRGHWCPYCLGQLAALKENHPAIARAGAAVLALSTDPPWQSDALARDMALPFTLLCDENQEYVKLYGLHNPHEMGGCAKPAVVVLDSQGKVLYRALETPYKRLSVPELLDFLSSLAKNPEHTGQNVRIGGFGLPLKPGAAGWQAAKNMVRLGTAKNWRHFALYPAVAVKKTFSLLSGTQNVAVVQSFAAPPETVFAHVSDPGKMSAWADGILLSRIKESAGGPGHPDGAGAVRAVRLGPLAFEETILACDPPRSYEYTISKGTPLKNYLGRVDVFPKGEGAELHWTFRFDSKIPLTSAVVATAVKAGFSTGLRKLARRLRRAKG